MIVDFLAWMWPSLLLAFIWVIFHIIRQDNTLPPPTEIDDEHYGYEEDNKNG